MKVSCLDVPHAYTQSNASAVQSGEVFLIFSHRKTAGDVSQQIVPGCENACVFPHARKNVLLKKYGAYCIEQRRQCWVSG